MKSADLRSRILVVGGGPSGSVLAGILAGGGWDVLVVDRHAFPRNKACGECLNPGGVRVLERLNLLETVLGTRPLPLREWTLSTPSGIRARGAFPEDRFGLGVDRSSLDHALLNEARARGARIMEGLRVVDVDPGNGSRPAWARGRTKAGDTVRLRADLLVGADGLRSAVARSAGTVARRPRLRKASLSWRILGRGPSRERGRLLLGGSFTVGLAPVPSGPPQGEADLPAWNATLVVDPARFRTELSQDPWPLLVRGLDLLGVRWREGPVPTAGPWASGPFDWPSRTAVRGRTLLVGDAAGYYDPLTGQGLFRAVRSAELAAEAISKALPAARSERGAPAAKALLPLAGRELLDYDQLLRRSFGPGRRLQRVVEAVLARPVVREGAMGLLGRSSRATSALIRRTGDLKTHGGR